MGPQEQSKIRVGFGVKVELSHMLGAREGAEVEGGQAGLGVGRRKVKRESGTEKRRATVEGPHPQSCCTFYNQMWCVSVTSPAIFPFWRVAGQKTS